VNTPIDKRIRETIIRLRDEGRTYVEIADLVKVGYATVNRIIRLHRETGDITHRQPGGGNASPIRDEVAEALCVIVVENPDATVAEMTEMLTARGIVETSRSSVQRALTRLGFSRKKSPSRPASATRRSTANGIASSARSSR